MRYIQGTSVKLWHARRYDRIMLCYIFYQTVKRLITLRMTITAYYVTQDNDLFSQLEQAMMSMWRINGKYTFCCININNPKNSAMQFFHCLNLPKVISINSLLRLLWNAGTLCYMLKYPLNRTCMYDSDIPCLTDTILWHLIYVTLRYNIRWYYMHHSNDWCKS